MQDYVHKQPLYVGIIKELNIKREEKKKISEIGGKFGTFVGCATVSAVVPNPSCPVLQNNIKPILNNYNKNNEK